MTPGKLSTYSDLEAALMVIIGCYGNGDARRKALGSRYAKIQTLVDQILNTDRVPDGSGSDPDAIQKALMQTFYDTIEEITKEVIERMV